RSLLRPVLLSRGLLSGCRSLLRGRSQLRQRVPEERLALLADVGIILPRFTATLGYDFKFVIHLGAVLTPLVLATHLHRVASKALVVGTVRVQLAEVVADKPHCLKLAGEHALSHRALGDV